MELVEVAHERDSGGKRFYAYVGNGCADLYGSLVKWDHTSRTRDPDGWLKITHTQAARENYDDVHSYDAGGHAKHSSIRRRLDRLQSAGLLEWRGVKGHYLEVRLRAVPDVCFGSRPRSSAGSASGIWSRWQRRRETRRELHQARVKPWCRRTGQKGHDRLFLCPGELVLPGDGGAPKGSPPVHHQQEQTRERARAAQRAPGPAASAVVDPVSSACPPIARAALGELRGLLTEGGGSWPSGARPGPGTPLEALLLALWEVRCPGREPRLSRDVAAGLRRHGEVLDARHGHGAAVELVEDLMGDVVDGVWRDRYGTPDVELCSLAWVARQVKVAARAAVGPGARGPGRTRRGPRPRAAPRPGPG
jgi:hypothetical protein